MNKLIENIESVITSRRFLWFAAILVMCLVWWSKVRYLDIQIAYNGYTPVEWLHLLNKPANFAKDFPSGLTGYKTSLFMHVYPLADRYLQISPEVLMPWIIGLEILTISVAVYALSTALIPESEAITRFFIVVLCIASYTPNLDIARFGFANFYGLYYCSAQFFQLMAIVAVLGGRTITAYLSAALALLIHPIIGLFGLVFIIAMGLADIRRSAIVAHLTGFPLLLLLTIPWFVLQTDAGNYSSGTIPVSAWFDLTMLNGFHWYPVEFGYLTGNPPTVLYFLSFALLTIYYLGERQLTRQTDKMMAAGMLAMLLLTVAGILFSVAKIQPFFVKLALHRASGLIVLTGLPYVVHGLWQEIHSRSKVRKVLAVLVLISPFIDKPGYPLSCVLILTCKAWWPGLSLRQKTTLTNRLAALCVALCALLLLVFSMGGYWASYFEKIVKWKIYISRVVTVYALFLLPLYFFKKYYSRKLARITVFSLFIISLAFWIRHTSLDTADIAIGQSYRDVQSWARDHTPNTALFMVDPTIYYGWRGYSERSTFGNLRDWLYHWAYTSDAQHYQEGMKRFGEFGLDYHAYLAIKPSRVAFEELNKEVQKRFYMFDDAKRVNIGRRYGVDYFVLKKSLMAKESSMPKVYENNMFIVLKSPN